MTRVKRILAGGLGAGLLFAGPAIASDVERELAEMRELVEGLKDQVEAQEEQIEHQGTLLEESQKIVRDVQREDDALSSLAEFWQMIDVNMSVAGSYAYNFSKPDVSPNPGTGGPFPGSGANQGSSGLFYPFHGDHNSFQVDQVWFDIGKQATDESRAGFQFTMLFGNTAAFLGQGGNFAPRRFVGDSTSDYYVHQAYVSYVAPLGEGVEVDFGKFATLIGAEVADATQNFNITRGNVYNLFQPIDHLGVLASTNFGPVSIAAGVVNEGSLTNSSTDINKEKSYLGSLGFEAGPVGVTTTVLYGAEGGANGFAAAGDNEQKFGVWDVVASIEAGGVEAWINTDYVWVEGSKMAAWGAAIAAQVPIVDVLKAAVRLEYARDKSNLFGILGPRSSHVYSATGTLTYALAENLDLKGEVRWDRVVEDTGASRADEFFHGDQRRTDENQFVGVAQVVYSF